MCRYSLARHLDAKVESHSHYGDHNVGHRQWHHKIVRYYPATINADRLMNIAVLPTPRLAPPKSAHRFITHSWMSRLSAIVWYNCIIGVLSDWESFRSLITLAWANYKYWNEYLRRDSPPGTRRLQYFIANVHDSKHRRIYAIKTSSILILRLYYL